MYANEGVFRNALVPGSVRHGGDLWRISREGPTQIDNLSALVRHLVLLHSDGSLDDQAFSGLLKYAAALFVEAEAGKCLNQVLNEIAS